MNADTYGKFRQLVRVLGGYVRSGETSVWVRCPAHDDHDRSLSVCLDDWILVYCHAGCSEDAVFTAMRAALALDEALGDPVPGSAMHAAALSHRRAVLEAALGEPIPEDIALARMAADTAAALAAARGERGERLAAAYFGYVLTVKALGGEAPNGEVMAWAPCPVHGRRDEPIDPETSLCLWLWFKADGSTNVLCTGGCDQRAVVAAIDAVGDAQLGAASLVAQ